MSDTPRHFYPLDAMTEDRTLGLFRLDAAYRPDAGAITIGFGTRQAAGDLRAAVATTADGIILASGPCLQTPAAELASPEGGTILLERVVIGGTVVGYVASQPLVAGTDYPDTQALPGGSWMADRFRQPPGAAVPGFGPGTMIATEDGEQPVEWLRPGDRVLTRDNGYQPVLWVARIDAAPGLLHLAASSLGPGLPRQSLRVTPSQPILLHGPELELNFGYAEMFAEAGCLDAAADTPPGRDPVPECLFQLILPAQEIILAENLWVGTLLADATFLDTQPPAMARLAASLTRGRHRQSARGCLEQWEIAMLRRPHALAKGRIAA